MKTTTAILTAILLMAPAAARAGQTVDYPRILQKVMENSPLRARATGERDLADSMRQRAALHWAPRLYLDAASMNTNNPAAAFMTNLNQQDIRATDLAPDALNNPDNVQLTDVAVGLDLPLYEGGAGVSGQKAMDQKKRAGRLGLQASERTLEAMTANLYADLLNHSSFLTAVTAVADELDRNIEKYRIGRRANPVGYSGMLGLKAVRNKVKSYIRQSSGRVDGIRQALEELTGGLPEDWQPADTDPAPFAATALPLPDNRQALLQPSAGVQAVRTDAAAQQNLYEAEKSRALPRVGLFGEGNWYNGARNSATSQTVGVYVKWNFFDHRTMSAFKEAGLKKEIARQEARQAEMQERINKKQAVRTLKALEETIANLEDTGKLLAEQSDVSRRLFRNGSINALQLSGVIDNRVEALKALADARSRYYAVRADLYRLTNTHND